MCCYAAVGPAAVEQGAHAGGCSRLVAAVVTGGVRLGSKAPVPGRAQQAPFGALEMTYMLCKPHKQARDAGAALRGAGIDLVVTSPFKRCLQTSAAVVAELGLPQGSWLVDWGLSEVSGCCCLQLRSAPAWQYLCCSKLGGFVDISLLTT